MVKEVTHMKQQWTLFVIVTIVFAIGWLTWSRTKLTLSSKSHQFIRTVSGLPQDVDGWDVFAYYGKVFAYLLKTEKAPFTIYRIDPVNECVVESITVEQVIHPQAIIAKHYQHSDAWLAEHGFFTWQIDQQRGIAYAAKPSKLPMNAQEYIENGFEGIYVIDIKNERNQKVH